MTEGELYARLLAPLHFSTDRRFPKLVRIKKQSPGIAGNMHVGKDDLDVGAGDKGIMFGYVGDETCETEIRILVVGFDAGGKTTILQKLKLGEVVATTVWAVGCEDPNRPLRHHCYQDTSGLLYVVDSNDRDRVEEAKAELNKMMNEDEMRDAVVLACVNTVKSSTATGMGKKLTVARKKGDLWC